MLADRKGHLPGTASKVDREITRSTVGIMVLEDDFVESFRILGSRLQIFGRIKVGKRKDMGHLALSITRMTGDEETRMIASTE